MTSASPGQSTIPQGGHRETSDERRAPRGEHLRPICRPRGTQDSSQKPMAERTSIGNDSSVWSGRDLVADADPWVRAVIATPAKWRDFLVD